MKVFFGIDAISGQLTGPSVVTAGTFDGVHYGHRKILEQLKQVARKTGGNSVVITYDPHPRQVLPHRAGDDVRILSTLEEKIELLDAEGIDILLVINFTLEFSQWSSERYIDEIILKALNTKTLVIGYDHRFGRNREGSFAYLQAHSQTLGFDVIEIPRQDVDEVGVSSTKARHALLDGDLASANKYLGRPYRLTGIVEKGQQLGRTLGFPTANLALHVPEKLVPAYGVYACWVTLEQSKQKYMGALSIGVRPAVGGTYETIEVYILDFSGDLYGQQVKLDLISYLRPEWDMPSLEALKQQIALDVEQVRQLLSA